MTKTKTKKCCDLVYFHHEGFGWSVYKRSDGWKMTGVWIPTHYDPIIGDVPTKKEAIKQVQEMHPLGVCLIKEA